jgi:membrane-associated protein
VGLGIVRYDAGPMLTPNTEPPKGLIDLVRHLDKYIDYATHQYGTLTYAILAAIIFCETGLVVMPFLPGDSLLFACGAVASREGSGLSVPLLGVILIVAAIAGDTVNYHVGKSIGPRVMKSESSRWLNKKHLEKTHAFFEKYGGKTIILARFVPIVRTFAPFVAGAGAMTYSKFIAFNVIGAVLWVGLMMGAGVVFGGIPIVQKNFEIVVIGIVVVSVLPMVFEYLKARKEAAAEKAVEKAP